MDQKVSLSFIWRTRRLYASRYLEEVWEVRISCGSIKLYWEMALEICVRGEFFMETCDCWEVGVTKRGLEFRGGLRVLWGVPLEEFYKWMGVFLQPCFLQGLEWILYLFLAWCVVHSSRSQVFASLGQSVIGVGLLWLLGIFYPLKFKFYQGNPRLGARIS